jgi:hypothetical protein
MARVCLRELTPEERATIARREQGPASRLGLRDHERLVLGQEACAEKSNEITAIPALLARLAAGGRLKGALVSIDAISCNPDIAQAIAADGAAYLLAVKEYPALPPWRDRGLFSRRPGRSPKQRRKCAGWNTRYLARLRLTPR